MSYFHSFSNELLTTNSKDYRIDACMVPDYLYKASFTPFGVTCVVRTKRLIEFDLQLYENEIHLDSLTSHPNLIKILRHFLQPDNILWSIFPFSPYSSLGELCQPYGLPEAVITFVLADILQAIDYLHRNSIIHRYGCYILESSQIYTSNSIASHRAIKGSHVLMFGDLKSSVKFVLTGLKHSCQLGAQDDLQSFDYPTSAPKLLKCMAPEILEQNIIGYDFKADIYSIGILCCELANGIVPFDNMSTDQLLFYKIIGDTPGPLDSACEEMKIIQEYTDKMEKSLLRRYEVYSKRTFSKHFHEMVNNDCLSTEQSRRLSASELLAHKCIKQNLAQHSHCKMSLLTQYLSKR